MKLNHLAPPHVSKDMNYSIDREGNILFNFVAFQIFSLSYCFLKTIASVFWLKRDIRRVWEWGCSWEDSG